ncbi:MAG: MATE family efflux transporter [Lentisphaeria bacterium]|nr:MATE family efflux transporter [Lentisphaeria bacterium]
MPSFQSIRKNHFDGPGGILELLPIAIPMFLSSMFDMLMMFIDRLFLSRVGIVHQAAAMSGGTTSWMVTSFFVGIVGYSSTLIAQYLGANQKHNCVKMVWQAMFVALLSYPFMLLISLLVNMSPVFDGHSPLEQSLERRYFWYMAFGSINALMRFTFGSFFSGIGKTKVIMYGNVVALIVNLVANWILIFGHLGCPALGLDGAAIGTLLSGASASVLLAIAFWRAKKSPEWHDSSKHFFDLSKFFKLLRYGLPQGCENVLGMICFVFLVSSFHSYGDDMATATTIIFNWDGFSFHPLLGIQVAVTTLVGRAMGKGDPELAVKTTRSGFKVALSYASLMLLLFLTLTATLVNVFAPESSGLDYSHVRELAMPMLRMAGIYILTDATLLIASGALRGAGDTFWCMAIHFLNNLIISLLILFCVHKLDMPPLRVWLYFVIFGALSSFTFLFRYKLGRWKKLRIIENTPDMA